ncbi:uncharacterized protein LOC141632803 [Silene latifolia]|uniref:uncharacterized protein LOC141632803 n=1 Tax=Silene latifolia TaxID=37657 RepID=UPI003D774FC1
MVDPSKIEAMMEWKSPTNVGKANVVADALSRKSTYSLSVIRVLPDDLCAEFRKLSLKIVESGFDYLGAMVAEPVILREIRDNLVDDATFKRFQAKLLEGKAKDYEIDASGYLRYQSLIYVLDVVEYLRKRVLEEAHLSPYSIHPGGDKMYKDLKLHFWWPHMKNGIVTYVGKCLTCQQVKIEHKRPGETWSLDRLASAYVEEIIRYYGVPKEIMSDRDPRFCSIFWKAL